MAKARSAGKELFFLVLVFVGFIGALFVYTGTWPPAVIVESGSMMHRDSEVSYGRIGTIDPGDMVLVKSVDGADDVHTWAERQSDRYGDWGDVVVYHRGGNATQTIGGQEIPITPIIHRAIAWVDVQGSGDDREYWVHWAADVPCPSTAEKREHASGKTSCVFGESGITIPEVGLAHCKEACGRDGLITKGDNPFTNRQPDQVAGISHGMVQPDWIVGKARGEIPWLGLIKLALGQQPNEMNPNPAWVHVCMPVLSCPDGGAYAPKDLWVMLGASLFVLIGLPVTYDAAKAMGVGRRGEDDGDDEGDDRADAAPAPSDDDDPRPPGDDPEGAVDVDAVDADAVEPVTGDDAAPVDDTTAAEASAAPLDAVDDFDDAPRGDDADEDPDRSADASTRPSDRDVT